MFEISLHFHPEQTTVGSKRCIQRREKKKLRTFFSVQNFNTSLSVNGFFFSVFGFFVPLFHTGCIVRCVPARINGRHVANHDAASVDLCQERHARRTQRNRLSFRQRGLSVLRQCSAWRAGNFITSSQVLAPRNMLNREIESQVSQRRQVFASRFFSLWSCVPSTHSRCAYQHHLAISEHHRIEPGQFHTGRGRVPVLVTSMDAAFQNTSTDAAFLTM